MTHHKQSTASGERGAIMLVSALGLVAMLGLTAFAVDLGYIYARQSQLQKAADLAALAGAGALVAAGGDLDRVRREAVRFGQMNLDDADDAASAVRTQDVSFYLDGVPDQSAPNQVEVRVGRTQARGNPLELFFARMLGTETADLEVRARAAMVEVCASKCLKPFAVPEPFTWDDTCDEKGKFNGNGLLDQESQCEMASVSSRPLGPQDIGRQVMLKLGTHREFNEAFSHSQWGAVAYPPVNKGTPKTGANTYRDNIGCPCPPPSGCANANETQVSPGDEILMEPGNMHGPTRQGLQALIATDPGAHWSTATRSIVGSNYPDPLGSPRVVIIVVFDPKYPPRQGRDTIRVSQLAGFFVEGGGSQGEITGRYITAIAKTDQALPGECNLYTVRLIKDSSRGG